MGSTEDPFYETTSLVFSNNTAPKQCPPLYFPQEVVLRLMVERWCLGLEFFLAIFGNACMIVSLYQRKNKWNRMYMYLLHLGIADLLVAFFFILPEWLIRMLCGFHGSNGLCKFQSYMQILSMYGSTLVLLAVGVDRYMAICHPLTSLNKSGKNVHIIVALLWTTAAALALPQVFIFEKSQSPSCISNLEETPNKIYVTWYLLAILFIPSVMLAFLYGMIIFTISNNIAEKKKASTVESTALTRKMETTWLTFIRPCCCKDSELKLEDCYNCIEMAAPRVSSTRGLSRAKIKTVKMTVVVVCTYMFCWTPFFIVQMMSAWRYNFDKNAVPVVSVMQILGCLSSCTNPWIYILFSGKCLSDIRNIFFRTNKKRNTLRDGGVTGTKSRYYKSQVSIDGQTELTTAVSYQADSPLTPNKAVSFNDDGKKSLAKTTV